MMGLFPNWIWGDVLFLMKLLLAGIEFAGLLDD